MYLEEKEQQDDVAFFLYIPRMGGRSLLDFIGPCFNLVQASDLYIREGTKSSGTKLQILESDDKGNYVNVNTFSIDGIIRAKELGFFQQSSSIQTDIISTPFLHETLDILFSPRTDSFLTDEEEALSDKEENGGRPPEIRLITLLRDPLDQVNSNFHYFTSLTPEDEDYDPSLPSNVTFIQYLNTPQDRREFNYLTKLLVNKLHPDSEPLTKDDLRTAKQILFQKCIVGLLENKSESLIRWQKLFHWQFQKENNVEECSGEFLNWQYSQQQDENDPKLPSKDSDEYMLLVQRNSMDVELFEFAKNLYIEQGSLFLNESP